MSEFEGQFDSCEVICPYCDHKYEPEDESFSEDQNIEKCDNCGKKYKLCQVVSVDHQTEPDCEINDTEHEWEMVELRDNTQHEFCVICGQCKPFN